MREGLGVGEDSPLKALEFVEHFEHFDRRLETWYVTSEQRRFFDPCTEPLDVLAETAPEDRFRGYQTEKNATILFQGETYDLRLVSRAAEQLQSRAEEEMQKAPLRYRRLSVCNSRRRKTKSSGWVRTPVITSRLLRGSDDSELWFGVDRQYRSEQRPFT